MIAAGRRTDPDGSRAELAPGRWTVWTRIEPPPDPPRGEASPSWASPLRWGVGALAAAPEVGRVIVHSSTPERLRPWLDDLPNVTLRRTQPDLRAARSDLLTLLRQDLDGLPELLGDRLVVCDGAAPMLRPATLRAALAAWGAGQVGGLDAWPGPGDGSACLLVTTAASVARGAAGAPLLRWQLPPEEATPSGALEDPAFADRVERARRRPPTAVLFDLDGTLIDSVPDVAWALSEAVAVRGWGPFDGTVVRRWIGRGARALVAACHAEHGATDDSEIASDLQSFLTLYRGNPARSTRPFEGVEALLARLERDRVPIAICTNKPRVATDVVLSALGWSGRFGAVLCPEDAGAKPSPAMLFEALRRLDAAASGAVLVGDGPADRDAAAAAGLPFAWVTWGAPEPPLPGEVEFDDPQALDAALDAFAGWGWIRPGPPARRPAQSASRKSRSTANRTMRSK